jgi:hypothetical protein
LVAKQAQIVGNKIVDNAETVYYMGPPARITLDESFPDRITNIVITGLNDIDYLVWLKNIHCGQFSDILFSPKIAISAKQFIILAP